MEKQTITVADEVWIATALLQREHPERADFSKSEIMERAAKEKLFEPLRPGVSVHISTHAVANKKPQPNAYRMLFDTGRGRRRLFRDGDPVHPDRDGKQVPEPEDVPERYQPLLEWYRWWRSSKSAEGDPDPLLALAGTWTFGDADTYLREHRSGWENDRGEDILR